MGEKAFNMILIIESLFDVDRIKYNGIKFGQL